MSKNFGGKTALSTAALGHTPRAWVIFRGGVPRGDAAKFLCSGGHSRSSWWQPDANAN